MLSKIRKLAGKVFRYIRFIFSLEIYLFSFKRLPGEIYGNINLYLLYSKLARRYRKSIQKINTENQYRKSNEENSSSDIVWWLWLQGEENAPPVCKACLASVRRCLPDKKIIVLDEKNLWDYVDFPDYIKDKYRRGLITRTHFSDLLRMQLLATYGGLWADSTVYFTGRPDFAFGRPFFSFKGDRRGNPSFVFTTWFFSSQRNNPMLSLTLDLHLDYWKKHNKVYHYFMFDFFFKMASEIYSDEWEAVPFISNLPAGIMGGEKFKPFTEERFEQLKAMSPVHKLTYKYDETQDISGTILEHIIKSVDSPI